MKIQSSKQKKNSLLCPNCRRLISRDEESCPHCGIRHPGAWWKNSPLLAGFSGPEQVISLIIAVNVGMYVLSLLLSPRHTGLSAHPFDFLSPGNRSLMLLGSTGTVAILRLHQWWTLVAANYLHGSLLHILFNMMALRQIGPLVIAEYGENRMLAIYTLGGIGGYLLSVFAGVRFTIGASAAICSLIGAVLYFGKSRGGTYGENIYRQVGSWAVGIFLFGLMVPGINNWAHGGGMATGALAGYLLGYRERRREQLWQRLLGMGCVAITAMVLTFAVLRSVLLQLLR